MTDVKALHEHGLTFHQTGPLQSAGHKTVEAVAALVDDHRGSPWPPGSTLSQMPNMGPRRVAVVCEAVDAWRAAVCEPARERPDVVAALIELAEIVRGHLAEAEAQTDSVVIGPEPSDRVAELIERLR